MFTGYTPADKANTILFAKVERRLEALLAEHGAFDPNELPHALQFQLLQHAIIEAAATDFPAANLEMLQHGLHSFTHPAFKTAMERMRVSCKTAGDAFEMSTGIYAAIVLAGYGLPVAPFDLQAMRILAEPSKDIDAVRDLFSRDKDAYVGYSTCNAPFYVLLTDCVQSLRRLVPTHPWLSEVKELLTRTGQSLPPDPGQSFIHGSAVIARQPGDAISTVMLFDPRPTGGSVVLYAGGQVDGKPRGAPCEGYVPVPGQLLRAVVNEPSVAYSFWEKGSAPAPLH